MRASRERGKPLAALTIIATIFAVAFVIKLVPPATRQALLPVAHRDLPSRALVIWSAHAPSMSAAPAPARRSRPGAAALIVMSLPRRDAEREGGIEPTGDAWLTFDADPGAGPLIPATPLMPVALPMAGAPVHAETEIGDSPLVMPFTKTGSALRVAFVKTGSAIKAAASGTAGVFVSNP
jgi:hypothetical protein